MKRFLLLLVIIAISIKGNSQSDPNVALQNITPVSPNSASLGKYGDVPVSTYTGIPQINIPLLNYGSGSLRSDISLSYHASGIKVEELASWVGAGWSLNAGGVIARSIRGIADEVPNGFMNADMTVQFMLDNFNNPTYADGIRERMINASKGLYDTEPDIYVYNFGGYTGKFFYNQEAHTFYTVGKSNIKITFDDFNQDFTITADNGNIYHFTVHEISTQNYMQCDNHTVPNSYSSNTSSWLLSKIENSAQTDSVAYTYTNSSYNSTTLGNTTKYILRGYSGLGDFTEPSFSDEHCSSELTIETKDLSSITTRNSRIQFTTGIRCDLPGAKSLEKIELFDLNDSLVKRFMFSYGYLGNSDTVGCSVGTGAEGRRLKLSSIQEDSLSSHTVSKPPYRFDYNVENGTLPGRLSYEQDFWGYYNGASANTDLVPPTIYTSLNSGTLSYWNGANRYVDTVKAQFGVLTKITYPTGGSTEFTFESNDANDTLLPPISTFHQEWLEGDHAGGAQTTYERQFTINYPPNYLNGYNANGGVFANFMYEAIGCEFINGQANNCAVLTLEKLIDSTWYTAVGPIATTPILKRYVPNGTYKLKAHFNQNPTSGYEDFYFQMTWQDPDTLHSPKAGGVRVKKIKDFDGIDHLKDKVRVFEYKTDNGKSSGKFASRWREVFTSEFSHRYFGCYLGEPTELNRYFVKRQSASQYPLLTTQGSYVGYSQVTMYSGESGENGKTVYNYDTGPDFVDGSFPFAYTTMDWWRGNLLEEKTYKKSGNDYVLVKKVTDSIGIVGYGFHSTIGRKMGFADVGAYNHAATGCIPLYAWQELAELEFPAASGDYETISGWSWDAKSTSKEYSQLDTSQYVQKVTAYEYDSASYLPTRIETSINNGEKLITYITYPDNYLTGYMPYWLGQLIDLNYWKMPIEVVKTKKLANGNEYVISAVLTTYKTGKPLSDKIYTIDINEPVALGSFTHSYNNSGILAMDSRYSEKISFVEYDLYDNVLEQQKAGDMKQSYIWDYKSSFPVAEVNNAANADIAATSFESDGNGGWEFSGSIISDATAPTGTKCYDLNSGDITKTLADGGTYIVSYWSKNGSYSVNRTSPTKTGKTLNGWTYYEHEITFQLFDIFQITISGSDYIDEVRLYPQGSPMNTYTYQPLIGMTSQCDAHNNIIYYHYDGLGRLVLIKDEDQHILKKIQYKYQATPQQ